MKFRVVHSRRIAWPPLASSQPFTWDSKLVAVAVSSGSIPPSHGTQRFRVKSSLGVMGLNSSGKRADYRKLSDAFGN